MKMMKVKQHVQINQEICRLGDNKTNFQSGLPAHVRQGFSLICTKVSIQCPFFVYLTLSDRCNNIIGNIIFLRSDTYPPVLINE